MNDEYKKQHLTPRQVTDLYCAMIASGKLTPNAAFAAELLNHAAQGLRQALAVHAKE